MSMEMLFVVIGGALVALAFRYILPGRATYGSALLPALGAAVSAVVWAALTWLGWSFDGGWIWWVSLGAAAVAAVALPLLVAPRRSRHDEELFERLSRP